MWACSLIFLSLVGNSNIIGKWLRLLLAYCLFIIVVLIKSILFNILFFRINFYRRSLSRKKCIIIDFNSWKLILWLTLGTVRNNLFVYRRLTCLPYCECCSTIRWSFLVNIWGASMYRIVMRMWVHYLFSQCWCRFFQN